ncbi:MAG: hypothetical protein WD875_01440 [Pirellulales bacterium]
MLHTILRRTILRYTAIAWLLACAACFAAEPIEPTDFSALHTLIQPKLDESAWLSIPWQTDLWQAREKAAAAGKPILLWEMDGHPLGCT